MKGKKQQNKWMKQFLLILLLLFSVLENSIFTLSETLSVSSSILPGEEGAEENEEISSSNLDESLYLSSRESVLDYTEGFHYSISPGIPTLEKNGNRFYLIWTYKLKFFRPSTMTDLYLNQIQNYFTTTKDSGLGRPELIELKENGGATSWIAGTESSNSDLMQSLRIPIDPKLSSFGNTEFEMTIRASIEEFRYFYAMDFHAEALFNVPALSVVKDPSSPSGVRLLTDDEEIAVKASRREAINAYSFHDSIFRPFLLALDESYYENSIYENDAIVSGDYLSETKIRWLLSQRNVSRNEEDFPLEIVLDPSQEIEEVKVYYYVPDENSAFVLDHTDTFIPDSFPSELKIPAGGIAQVEVQGKIKDEKKEHSFMGAKLESLKEDLKIKKLWATGSTPVDTSFHLSGGKHNDLDETLTISSTTSLIEKADLEKFDGLGISAKRISYDVEEIEEKDTELLYKSFDQESLYYIFKNKRKDVLLPSGTCGDYGVTSIDPIEINEYLTKDYEYGHGGKLSGKFKIPARAKAGSYFTLNLPKELIISHPPSGTKKYFDIEADGKVIGEVFHIGERTLKFVLNENAYSSVDYEGTFHLGTVKDKTKLGRVNGGNVNGLSSTIYYSGIDVDKRYFYDSANPNNKTVNKNLTFTASYMDRDHLWENCEKTISQNGTVYYKDPYLDWFKALMKEVSEVGSDYVKYRILLNIKQDNSWLNNNTIIEQLTDTIEMYSGNNAASLKKDIKIYEVKGLRHLSYEIGSEKEIYPNKDASASGSVTVKWNAGMVREGVGRGFMNPIRQSDYISFAFQNTKNNTILIELKVKTTPGYEKKYTGEYQGKFFNFLWSQRGFGLDIRDFIGTDYSMTSGESGAFGLSRLELYSLNLKKVDQKRNPIKNNSAVFRLQDKNGIKIADFITDKEGNLKIEGLTKNVGIGDDAIGEYYLQETDAPERYIRNSKIYKIKIDKNGKILFGEKGASGQEDLNLQELQNGQTPEIINRKNYTLKLLKMDEVNNSLKGAKFHLYSSDYSFNQTTGDEKNQSAFYFYNLSPSEYILEELESPADYSRFQTGIHFRLKDDGGVELLSGSSADYSFQIKEEDCSIEISLVNRKVKYGAFRIKKISDMGNPLGKAKFGLTPLDTPGTEMEKKTLSGTGYLYFEKLSPGLYRLREIEAPEGFTKTLETYLVEVDQNGNTVVKRENGSETVAKIDTSLEIMNFEIINKRKREPHILPLAGGSGVGAIQCFGLLLFLIACVFLWLEKRKREQL